MWMPIPRLPCGTAYKLPQMSLAGRDINAR
nr:MAG TPA: hypothetical protein [Caudoviricetes sp.]